MRQKVSDDLASIDEALDRALSDAMHSSADVVTRAKINRRRWFGLGALVLATFCMAVAAVPWSGKEPIDIAIWIIAALVLLIAGGGSFYKADRYEDRAEKLLRSLRSQQALPERKSGLRRLK